MGGQAKNPADEVGNPFKDMAAAIQQASVIQAQSADKAMQIANEQFQQSLQFVTQQYNQARADVMPYVSNGYAASDEMKEMLGLGSIRDALPANAADALQKAMLNNQVDFGRYKSTTGAYGMGDNFGTQTYQPNAIPVDAQNGYNQYLDNERDIQTLIGMMQGHPAIGAQGINDPAVAQYAHDHNTGLEEAFFTLSSQPASGGLSLDQLSQDPYFMAQWKAYGLPLEQKFVQGNPDPEKINAKLAATPGYQFNLKQGLSSVQNSAAAKGSLDSGNTLKGITEYGQGMAQNTFNDRMTQLGNLAQLGQNSATFTATQAMQQGENVANMRQQLGDTLGSGEMAKGSILSNGLIGSKRWDILGKAFQAQKDAGSGGGGMGGMGGVGQIMGLLGGMGGGMAKGGKIKKGQKKVMGETNNQRGN